MQVFLDMDGVLADFPSAVCNAHNRPNPYTDPNNFGKDILECWPDMCKKDYWLPAEFDFWANLKPLPDFEELIGIIKEFVPLEEVCILTSPSRNRGCKPGKLKWIEKYLPEISEKNIFFCSEKWRFALDKDGKQNILIDDTSKKTEPFIKAGGEAYLVPRPWNHHFIWRDEPYELLPKILKDWMKANKNV
jgi:5'(3')-deoxyribonucleotidase